MTSRASRCAEPLLAVVGVGGDALLYPGPPAQRVALDDLVLEADIVRRALGFLGGRSRVD